MLCSRVWLGATIVNQEEADRDIPKLLATPARVRFLSMEPLLGPVEIGSWLTRLPKPIAGEWMTQGIDWVIVGGESGPGARPMHPGWARSLRDQCEVAGVQFLFKQWGEWTPDAWADARPMIEQPDHRSAYNWSRMYRIGKKAAGRLLDGVEHNAFPETAA
jgi:protein gp37